ncbi:MAG: sulfotransferase family protein [Pseudomonadota bacterium]|nr:sulfotransferase family protein [Pseudomonadota bacterium]HJO36139.1 sulfotransferase family protein [Gammaproteobacteria bacterium]
MDLYDRWRVPRSPFHRRFPSRSPEMALTVNRRIAVDTARRFIYFRVPKAANSTVVRSLMANDPSRYAKAAKRAFSRPDALSRRQVRALPAGYFLFTVVRNPYARIASAYLDKVVRGAASPTLLSHARALKVLAHLGKPAGASVSFAEFCRYLAEGGIDGDPHWFRQVDLIPCGPERLHFIGRVESLAVDLASILARINGTPTPAPERDWVRHRTGANERLAALYDADTLAAVRTLYAEDFARLGYEEAPFW